jgi:hypothetical protein
MESDVLVVLLDDCPYAAGERAPTTAIDSAASRRSRDPLPMSLTRPLMFPQFVFSYSDPHTIFLEVETYKLLQHRFYWPKSMKTPRSIILCSALLILALTLVCCESGPETTTTTTRQTTVTAPPPTFTPMPTMGGYSGGGH